LSPLVLVLAPGQGGTRLACVLDAAGFPAACAPSSRAAVTAAPPPRGGISFREYRERHGLPRGGAALLEHPAPPQATFVFGREGGNIRPYTVAIYTDGTVTASGPVSPTPRHLTEAADTIAGLLTLARAEGFFALPTQSVEEPVVPKPARVTGEVRVGKTAETATRTVGDEVRTEEVEGLCPCHREHRPRRPAAWRRTCSPGDAVVRLGSPGAT
jgi:hypothetical protein